MARILIVEDHETLCTALKTEFEKEGYEVESSENYSKALERISEKFDLIILDWMLPDGQGIDLLTALRKNRSNAPVIFLTARAELVDKVIGLEMGANDYLTKPFEFRELLARVRVQLRENKTSEVLTVGPLRIDRIKHKVLFKNQNVELVKKEYDLLSLLAESPEKVFSRDEILNKVWGFDIFPTTRTVDMHVMLLRQKLSDDLIETVRSVGYRLRQL